MKKLYIVHDKTTNIDYNIFATIEEEAWYKIAIVKLKLTIEESLKRFGISRMV